MRHESESGWDIHTTPSVAPRVDRLNRISRSGSSPGRRDRRLTTPPMAPAP